METPFAFEGLRRYDGMAPADAALTAWREMGPHPEWHRRARREVELAAPGLAAALALGDRSQIEQALKGPVPGAVRSAMPLLARAADRV